jgi:hypothetical protein
MVDGLPTRDLMLEREPLNQCAIYGSRIPLTMGQRMATLQTVQDSLGQN